MAEWTCSIPTDVVKTRIQSGKTPRGTSYATAFADVYREHGVRGYYRGFVPTILRAFPANGAALANCAELLGVREGGEEVAKL